VDRVFSIAGFGTVVTGTLSDGQFRVGDEVEIVPAGPRPAAAAGLRARIRGLQTHRRAVEIGLPGSRLAINLTGIHPDQLARGMVVARPGSLTPTTLVDVRLRLTRDASPLTGGALAALRHNQAVDFYSGAAEAPAHVRLLDAEEISPGGWGWAQLRLERPVALAAGDRFIVRQASPSLTVGGGQVVNPHPARRWRRFQAEVIAQIEALARGDPADLLLHTLNLLEPAPLRVAVERSGLDGATAERTAAAMLAEGQLLPLGALQPPLVSSQTPVISAGGWRTLAARMTDILAEYHASYPLRPGMAREELKSRLQGRDRWAPKLFNELIAHGAAAGALEEAGDFLRRPGYRITFTPEQQGRVDALLAAFRRQPFTPPSMAEGIAATDADTMSALLHMGTLVRLSEDVIFLRETYEEMVAQIVAHLRSQGSITVAQVRDRFNASRKYALAIMEHLDERRITRRVGDERVLR
jgi:selenocysteine-specific elongation factor